MKNKFKSVIVVALIVALTFNSYSNTSISDIETCALNTLKGSYVAAVMEQNQQRFYKANIIKNMPKHVDVVTIGSSHLLTVSNEDVGDSHINLSIGGSTLQDRLNVLGMLEYYGISYDKLIYELDIASLVSGIDLSTKSNIFNSFGNYFLNVLKSSYSEIPIDLDYNKYYVNKYNLPLTEFYRVEEKVPEDWFYYKPDASIGLAKSIKHYTDELKNNNREILFKVDVAYKDAHIREEAKQIIIKTFKYMKSKNIRISLVMVPRPPYVFNSVGMKDYELLQEINEFATYLSKEFDCKVSGSIDPNVIGAKDEDYYDGFHMYADRISKFINID